MLHSKWERFVWRRRSSPSSPRYLHFRFLGRAFFFFFFYCLTAGADENLLRGSDKRLRRRRVISKGDGGYFFTIWYTINGKTLCVHNEYCSESVYNRGACMGNAYGSRFTAAVRIFIVNIFYLHQSLANGVITTGNVVVMLYISHRDPSNVSRD